MGLKNFGKNFICREPFLRRCVLTVHSKITFSIARNVIMIGLLSKREDDVISSSRLVYIYTIGILVRTFIVPVPF